MADRTVRVLLVVGETAGGIGRHVAQLAERLGRNGVTAAVCGPRSALDMVGQPPGVGLEPLGVSGMRPDALLAARRRLRSLARGFDVVHAHGLRAGAVAAARPRRTALVVTWHNAALVRGTARIAHDALSRYVARAADLTLGASPDLTAAARQAGARDARDTFVVAPPLPSPSRSRDVVRAELHVGSEPMVLAVGRLQAQKRLDVLIDAAARWDASGLGPAVVVAGSGPDEAGLRSRARDKGARVRFLGARSDISDLLHAADVMALPSEWEARSLVAQEALRAGVPLVTTSVGGLPDLVGDAAVLVPVGDVAALREALQRLVADQGLRRQLADAGRARAATWPTIDESVARLAATYRELVG
ncbi:MAG: glycosyltransferase family 4 protein [Mycobacteriales bacterium]